MDIVTDPPRFETTDPEAGAALVWWCNGGSDAVAKLVPHVPRGYNFFNMAFAVLFPAGRNDLCPCGSGKKHKRCCLS
jgi:uncharacterized protein YecA (UPF0149 family)